MRVPIFVSVPSTLTASQRWTYELLHGLVVEHGLDPRTLGRSEGAHRFPLRDVVDIGRRCSGGLVLGFEQLRVTKGLRKPGTAAETAVGDLPLATPWNQLEAGVLFALGLPLLIFRDEGVEGGVFDAGAAGSVVHPMPAPSDPSSARAAVAQWRDRVRAYHGHTG